MAWLCCFMTTSLWVGLDGGWCSIPVSLLQVVLPKNQSGLNKLGGEWAVYFCFLTMFSIFFLLLCIASITIDC